MTARRHIHLQPLGGIAGDMFVAAMLDAFPQLAAQVLADVAAVLPSGVGEARLRAVSSNGIAARHFFLDSAHGPGHARDHGRHPAAEAHDVVPQAPPHHGPHSATYDALCHLIQHSALSRETAAHAVGILRVIAEAESVVHSVPLSDVHFHEIADWDSLMDVVAAGSVISGIGDAVWSVDALPLGGGRVPTRHGLLPVPAPATALILQGLNWRSDGIEGERVTPTGAAIVRYLVPTGSANGAPEGVLRTSGYGAGTRALPGLANVLRVMAFEPSASPQLRADQVAVVQFDVDDMTGEEIGIAADRLRGEAGVLDLVMIQAQGKKGRPVTIFQLLAERDALQRCGDAIFFETSTIGLRWTLCDRRVLPRRVDCSGDDVRVKEVQRPDGITTRKAESDDLEVFAGLRARRAVKAKHEEEQ